MEVAGEIRWVLAYNDMLGIAHYKMIYLLSASVFYQSGYLEDFKNQIPCIFPVLFKCYVCKHCMLNELVLIMRSPCTPNAINLE